ncbi:MAG: ferredoxin family protein [Tepidisphaeraceae bacterium]|jgi:NAD-dependent dihydropyrimidine dehydrogenase PreA subunit
MAYIIALPCIGVKDASCVEACPINCIHPTKNEPGYQDSTMLYIDPSECIDCGMCQEACPVNAIYPESDLPQEWSSFIEKNAAYYRKPAASL